MLGGFRREHKVCVHLSGSHSATPRTEPGVTELSRLTSDSVLTADRRGGILISFGLHRTPFGVINPSNGVRGESNSPRKPAAETELNGLPCRSLSAFHPSALYHLRASDRRRAGGRLRPAVRIPFESRRTHKPVDSTPLCALVTRFLRPVLDDSVPADYRVVFPVPKRNSPQIERARSAVGNRSDVVWKIEECVARLEADSSSHACASGRVGCLAAHSSLVLLAENQYGSRARP
jgi:hypothetical protein